MLSLRSTRCLIFAATVLVAGCKKAPPLETWPVRGTVVDQNGQSPTGGVVRLLTDADAHLITVGPIQPDGSFVVHTQRQGYEYEGAVAGEYRIAVMTAKKGPDGSDSPVRFDLPKPTVVEPAENQFTVKIQR